MYIICIDEMDSVCTKRRETINNFDNSVTNQLLSCMSHKVPPNLLIFGTTNRIDLIDPAILRFPHFFSKIFEIIFLYITYVSNRQGRLGIKYKFNLPTHAQRAAVLKLYANKIPADYAYVATKGSSVPLSHDELDRCITKLAAETNGFSAADLSSAVTKSKLAHLNGRNGRFLNIQDIADTLNEQRRKLFEAYILWHRDMKVSFIFLYSFGRENLINI